MSKALLDISRNAQPGMLRDALAGIVGLAHDAEAMTILNIPGMPEDMRAYHVRGMDEPALLTLPKQPMRQKVDSLETLLALARNAGETPSIWYDESEITLVYGHTTRREWATMQLKRSPVFLAVENLKKHHRFDQKNLLRWLRFDLSGALSCGGPELLAAAKTVKFRKQQEGESTIVHGKASLGKNIQAEVAGASDIPEQFRVLCSVFMNSGCRCSVLLELGVEVDVDAAEFVIRPLSGEIETAFDLVLADIVRSMRSSLGDAFPILAGRPW